jgi:hypothetical protein
MSCRTFAAVMATLAMAGWVHAGEKEPTQPQA